MSRKKPESSLPNLMRPFPSRLERAARAVLDSIGRDSVELAKTQRYKFSGSGGMHFISHARVDELRKALANLEREG